MNELFLYENIKMFSLCTFFLLKVNEITVIVYFTLYQANMRQRFNVFSAVKLTIQGANKPAQKSNTK